jgi:hypothetical protein
MRLDEAGASEVERVLRGSLPSASEILQCFPAPKKWRIKRRNYESWFKMENNNLQFQ